MRSKRTIMGWKIYYLARALRYMLHIWDYSENSPYLGTIAAIVCILEQAHNTSQISRREDT